MVSGGVLALKASPLRVFKPSALLMHLRDTGKGAPKAVVRSVM